VPFSHNLLHEGVAKLYIDRPPERVDGVREVKAFDSFGKLLPDAVSNQDQILDLPTIFVSRACIAGLVPNTLM
jgi:hypothetical protein